MCAIRKKVLTSSRSRVSTNSKTLFTAVSNSSTDGSSNGHNEEKKGWKGTTDEVELWELVGDARKTHVHVHFTRFDYFSPVLFRMTSVLGLH